MTANKYKIAITGGIGSGKSTVSSILTELGYKVYDADKIYADLISDESVIIKVSKILGIKPLRYDNKVFFDRKAAAIVLFSDKIKKKNFDNFVYPKVYQKIDDIYEKNDGAIFFEIPQLFETNRSQSFDKVIIVKRDLNERIASVKLRSGLTDEEIKIRIKNQIDYEKFDFSNHIVIHNNGDFANLKSVVEDCIAKIFTDNT